MFQREWYHPRYEFFNLEPDEHVVTLVVWNVYPYCLSSYFLRYERMDSDAETISKLYIYKILDLFNVEYDFERFKEFCRHMLVIMAEYFHEKDNDSSFLEPKYKFGALVTPDIRCVQSELRYIDAIKLKDAYRRGRFAFSFDKEFTHLLLNFVSSTPLLDNRLNNLNYE